MSLNFCNDCGYILQPEEDINNNKLIYKCGHCENIQHINDSCVYKNEHIITANSENRENLPEDIVDDPTLPIKNEECPQCKAKEAVLHQSFYQSSNVRKTGMKVNYICCQCKFQWEPKKEQTDD
eukprot:TRINITY_DN7279_c0_g1_i1.p1 TRINITY_DN7279_c0_g1~~TRINITY_DN7279_c0_g1_i1.p1  ORF type:complete len:124 (-),score=36.36 TRINITY_DN7279_c0_g1_i1:61-432(-)